MGVLGDDLSGWDLKNHTFYPTIVIQQPSSHLKIAGLRSAILLVNFIHVKKNNQNWVEICGHWDPSTVGELHHVSTQSTRLNYLWSRWKNPANQLIWIKKPLKKTFFTWFHTSKVVSRISSISSITLKHVHSGPSPFQFPDREIHQGTPLWIAPTGLQWGKTAVPTQGHGEYP